MVGGACVGAPVTAHVPCAETFAASFAVSALPGSEVRLPAGSRGSLEQVRVGSLGVARERSRLVLSSSGHSLSWCLVVPLSFFHASILASRPSR